MLRWIPNVRFKKPSPFLQRGCCCAGGRIKRRSACHTFALIIVPHAAANSHNKQTRCISRSLLMFFFAQELYSRPSMLLLFFFFCPPPADLIFFSFRFLSCGPSRLFDIPHWVHGVWSALKCRLRAYNFKFTDEHKALTTATRTSS